jgi:hypothetical protein
MIRKNATTETELLEWFGPASSRTMEGDGRKTLSWKFPARTANGRGSSGTLQVRLGEDGKVIGYTAAAGAK